VRVLVLDQFSEMGGAQQVLLQTLDAMRAADWTPFVALPGDGPLVDHVRALGIATARIRCGPFLLGDKSIQDVGRFAWQVPALATRIRRLAASSDADLLYVNGPRLLPAVALAGLRLPVVFHSHRPIPPGLSLQIAHYAVKRLQPFVIACCAAVGEMWRRLVPPDRLSVVYNGVDGPAVPAIPQDFSAPAIGCIGRISPEKGQLEFLQAARRIYPALPASRFVIFGEPLFSKAATRYAARVQEAASGLPVEFPGWVSCAPAMFSRLQLLLVPSDRFEATTRVILEAFAAGVPVVAFASGGIPEVVEDGRTGFLVNSAEEMGDRAAGLLRSEPERLRTVAANAREEWRTRFTVTAFQGNLMPVLQKVANRCSQAQPVTPN
jgi:glycosyltransferase involved in cell wall biosynthesis